MDFAKDFMGNLIFGTPPGQYIVCIGASAKRNCFGLEQGGYGNWACSCAAGRSFPVVAFRQEFHVSVACSFWYCGGFSCFLFDRNKNRTTFQKRIAAFFS